MPISFIRLTCKTLRNKALMPLFAIFLLIVQGVAQAEEPPVIAAAADLQFALPKIVEQFRKETGLQVKVSFGASGNLMRQIMQGGPYQIFFSADEQYAQNLVTQGLTQSPAQLYAYGQLVLWVPHDSPIVVEQGLQGVQGALTAHRLERLAIANPAVAPYGKAAQQALEQAHLWMPLQGKLVRGENIAQAAQLAASGSTQGGLISLSLALSPELKGKGRYWVIPSSQYAPLRQSMVLLKNASPTAVKFFHYVQSAPIKALLRQQGLNADKP